MHWAGHLPCLWPPKFVSWHPTWFPLAAWSDSWAQSLEKALSTAGCGPQTNKPIHKMTGLWEWSQLCWKANPDSPRFTPIKIQLISLAMGAGWDKSWWYLIICPSGNWRLTDYLAWSGEYLDESRIVTLWHRHTVFLNTAMKIALLTHVKWHILPKDSSSLLPTNLYL